MSWRNPHRGRGGSHHVGRLRIKAAAILSAHLGWEVCPEEIKPATGAWRTNEHFDVYRWEVFTHQSGNGNLPYIAGCWDTLTEFVRVSAKHGMHVVEDTIYPGPPPTE